MNKRVLPILLVVLLCGAGCRKNTQQPSVTPSDQQAQVYLPPAPEAETEQARNLRELREALSNFGSAKTFRSKMSVTTSAGTVTGQIDVMKPDRFHGTIETKTSGGTEKNEIIGIGSMMYVNVGNDLWALVKDPAKSKAYTDAFRSSVSEQASILPSVFPNDSIVTKARDAALDCDIYATTITPPESTSTPLALQVCVQNNLPKRITFSPAAGSATVDYFDYNKLFVIERPVGLYK